MKNIVISLIVLSLAACSKDNKSQVDVTETVQTQLDVSKDKVLTFLKNKAIRNFNFKKGTSTLYFASSNYESGIDLNKAEIDSRIDSFRGEHSLVLKCATRSKCGYGATFNSNNRKSVANAKE